MSDTGTVNIHGKTYQTVALRVRNFREKYPEHSLITEVLHRDAECVVLRATIADPAGRVIATGHAEEYLDNVLHEALTRPLTRDEILDLRLMAGIPDRQPKKAAPPASTTAALEPLPF